MDEPMDLQKDGREGSSSSNHSDTSGSSNKDQEHFCCSFCQERFLVIEDLLSHIRIHTGGIDSEEDPDEVQAPQKLKRLSVRLPLLKTAKMASLESSDAGGETSPNIASTSREEDDFERTDATPGYQCPTCKRRFSRIIHQLNHKCEPTGVENQLDVINSGLKLYKCVICKEEFGTRQEKIDHKCLTSESQNPEEEESHSSEADGGQDVADNGEEEESDSDKSSEDENAAAVAETANIQRSPKLMARVPTKKNLSKTRRRRAKAIHRCNVCHRSFTRSWNLKVHIQKMHPAGSPVQLKTTPTKAALRASPRPAQRSQDSSSTSDKMPTQSDDLFDFDFCPSYSEKNMVLRRVSSSNAYECPLCGKTMERREAVLSHIRDHRSETPYHCTHCEFECAHSAKMLKHLGQAHSIHQPNTPPQFEASKGIGQGSDWQPRKEPYRNFYKIVRSEKERMYKPKKNPDSGAFLCPICHKTFARFGVAQVHIRVHTGEAPFRCLLCEYQGKQQSLILAHLEHNHKDIISASNSHRDEEDDEEFDMEDDDDGDEEAWEKSIDFEEGIVNDKKEESEEVAEGNESESSESPDDQEPPVEPSDPDPYDFKFRPTQNELDRVLFRSSLTKMYLCHICPKEIKEKEIMLAHIRTHTGDKAYYCCHCEFGSAHDAAMRKHLLNVHGIKHAKRPENTIQVNIRLISKKPPSKPVMVTKSKPSESPKAVTKSKPSESPKMSSTKQLKAVDKKSSQQKSTPEKTAPPKPVQEKVVQQKPVKKQSQKESTPKQPKGPSYADFYIVNKSEKEEECQPQRNSTTGLYKCHFCKLESYSYKTVVIHTRTHTGEKPYKCRLCTFSAGQSSHVIRHLKNTHRVSLEDDNDSDDADDEPPHLKEEEKQEPQQEEQEQLEEATLPEKDNDSDPQDNGGDVDLDPVDYFAPSIPEEPVNPPPKMLYRDEDSLDETIDEGSQEGGDNDPDWETWMDRSTLSAEVRSAYKGKGKRKITSPKSAKVNYIFAPSEAEKQLDLKRGTDKQFGCVTCGKRMRELEIILAHIRTHTGDKPYSCCHCDFISAHIASIRKHVTKVHHIKRPVAGSDHQTPLVSSGKTQATPVPKKTASRPQIKVSPENANKEGVDMEERPYSEGTTEGYVNKFFKVLKKTKPIEKKYIPTRDALTGRAMCRICQNTFSSYGKAVVHIRCHTGEKPYQCLLCDYRSSQNPNMKRHIRNQHKELFGGQGEVVQQQPKDPNDLDSGDGQFAETSALDDDDHDLSGPSMVQRSDFLSQAVVAERQSNEPGRPDYLYEPTERMRTFEPKRSSTTGMFECTYCSSQFYGSKKIETHVLKHTGEKPYLCMHCDFKSAYSFVMYRHLLKRHHIQTPKHPGGASDNLNDNEESVSPDVESSNFNEAQESESAYTTSKPATPEALPTAPPTVTQTFPEGDFDFVFRPTNFELNQVIEMVGGGRLKCPHCKKLMSNKKKMVTHIRTHTGEKPFHCCHCDFKTAYKFVIQTHMKGIHKIFLPKGDDDLMEAQSVQDAATDASTDNVTIKQEPLDDTEDAMNQNDKGPDEDNFDDMVANMSTEAGNNFDEANVSKEDSINDDESMDDGELSDYSVQKDGQKPDCVFKSSETEKNRKLYRPSPSGPCQCPFCNRWLQGLENMRAHIRGHTGEKPYLCCHCDQKSAHFAAIKRHIIKVHRIKRPVMPGDVVPHPKPVQNSGLKKRPGLVVKFKHVSFPSNSLKPTQTKFKSHLSKPNVPRRAPAPFAARDRTLTQFYRNFYSVNKSEELKKYTPKKDPVTKLFHCNFCGKQFNYHTEAQVHTRTHTGEKPYQCLVCEYKGSQWTNIVRHITCVHKRILEAKQREAGIGNLPPAEDKKSSTVSASAQMPQETLPPEPRRLPLKGPLPTTNKPEADYMFQPSEEEKKHVILPSAKTGLYSCLFCKKKVPNLGKIVTHIRTHTGDKPFICCHCNFKSAYKFVMRQHLSGRHNIKWPRQMQNEQEDEQEVKVTPDEMQRESSAAAGDQANADFRFQPSERESTMELTRQSKTGCFECPFCGRQFSSSETMKAHIRGHTGDKAYYCCHCSFASAHIKSIRNHIQKVHNVNHPRRSEDAAAPAPPQKLVPATQIPKEVYLKYVGVNKTGTKKYPPKRNPRTGRFKCHFCVMESKQLYTVEIHTMRHTGERPYYCKLCEYKATRQWLVTQHLQTNHKHILAANEGLTLIPKETKKPSAPTAVKIPQPETAGDGIVVCRSAKTGMYYCSECRKEFLTSSQCKEHINTHSGDKPYQCPFCKHRSAHGGAMRNHMKIQHGNDSDELKKWYTYTMGKIAMQHVFQKDQDGMYMCTYCNKKSSSLNSARKHLCVHTGEKPYSCKICSFKAIHNISIRLHVTGHHKQITSAFSHSDGRSTMSAQSGQKNVAALGKFEEEMMADLEAGDEDEWEDEELSTGEHSLENIEEALGQYKATSPLSAVAPTGQVSTKDADFLYVPSEVDRDFVLQRSKDSQMYECPICSKQMTNTRTMRAHIRLHKGEKAYHCCHCDYKSAHYSVLRKHVVQVHKIQRPRMAQDVEEQDIPWVRQEPLKDARDTEPTSIGDLHLENPSKIPTNMNPESDQGFLFDANEEEKLSWQELQVSGSCQCPQCGKQCSSPIRTLQHMRTHTGAKPYHCKYCSFRSAYDTSMRNHVKTMHEVGSPWTSSTSHKSTVSEIRALQQGCEEDSILNESRLSEMRAAEKQSSSTSSDIKVKEEPQDNGYENKSSDMAAETPEMAWTFNEEDQSATLVPQYMAPPIIEDEDHSGPSSIQPESSGDSEDQSSLDMSHIEIEEQTPSMMQRYRMVQKTSVFQNKLAGDFTYEPSTQEKERVVPRSPSSSMYKCPYCPQELTSVDKIKAHIRKHTGDRPYQCLHCKFSSAYRFVIRTHIKNLHKIPEPKQDKSSTAGGHPTSQGHLDKGKFSSPSNLGGLADVYRPVLVDEKRSSPKRFLAAGKVSWAEHFKYIPSEAEKKLVLNKCSSTGKYQCPECSRVLSNIDVMRAHVRTHTGEKPYYCCHCDFQSAHYDSIRKHLIVIHKMKHEPDSKPALEEQVDRQDFNADDNEMEQDWQAPKFRPKSQAQVPSIASHSQGSDFMFKPSEYERNCTLKQSASTGLLQCPHCPKQHRLTDGMLAHIRTHTEDKPYVCCHCNYTCDNLSAIKLHLYIIHNVSKPTRPNRVMLKSVPVKQEPDSEEKSETDRYRHLFDIIKETKKDRKGQTFKRNPLTRAYKCNYCPKESKHHYVIQIHMRMHTGEKPYRCRLCDYKGAQQSRIIFHLKGKHGDYLQAQGLDQDQVSTMEQGEGVVATGMASYQQLENNASSQEHFVPKLNVDFTMERIESEEILLEKIQQSRNYKCLTCGKRCANAVRTIEHMRQHTGAKPYACMRCSTRSAYDRAIRNHVLLQHGRNAKEKEKLYSFHVGKIERSLELHKDRGSDRFMCPFCNKTFRDVNLARSHVRMHTGETPYRCKLCKFRGANTRAIQVHIERVHGNRSSGTSTASGAPMVRTDGEILRKRLKLGSDSLSESVGSSSNDDLSVRTEDQILSEDQSGQSPDKSYAGPKLNVDFTCDKVETEKMYCIDPASGGYKCLYCDKVLKSRHVSKIKNHLLLHIGAKPYKCIHCGFRSAHDGAIRSHVLSQHRKISRSYDKLYKFKVGKIERSLRLDQDPSGAYVCPYCTKRNRDLYIIKKHIRSHTGEKPYHCRKCSYMATLKWSVILHAQRQHKVKKSSSKLIGKHVHKKAAAVAKENMIDTNDDREIPILEKMKDIDLPTPEKVTDTVKEGKKIETEVKPESAEIEMADLDIPVADVDVKKDEDNTEKSMAETKVELSEDVANEIGEKKTLGIESASKTISKEEVESMESAEMSEIPQLSKEADVSSSSAQIESENNNESSKAPDEMKVTDATLESKSEKTFDNQDLAAVNKDNAALTESNSNAQLQSVNCKTETSDTTESSSDKEIGESAIPKAKEDIGRLEIDCAPEENDQIEAEHNITLGLASAEKPTETKLEHVVIKSATSEIQGDKTEATDADQKPSENMEVTASDETTGIKQDGVTSTASDKHQEVVGSSDIPPGETLQEESAPTLKQQVPKTVDYPDYLFKPSDEEKNFPKSNATGAFECPHCSKQFSDIVVMQTHIRKHSGDTPYHCNYCSFKSARFPEIRQHLLLSHKVHRPKTNKRDQSAKALTKKIDSSQEAEIEQYRSLFTFVPPKTCSYKPIRNTVSGLFECPICGSTSKRSNGARVHYRTHTGEKPYHCLLCPYRGAQQSRVVTHIKYNHKEVPMDKGLAVQPDSGERTIAQSKESTTNEDEQPDLEPVEGKDEFDDEGVDEELMLEENNLVIDETGFEEERGVKRKLLSEAGSTSSNKASHEPMWKKGYEYRPTATENEMVLQQDNTGVFMCPICPHKHKLKNVVRNHIRKHTGEKPYFCCHCNFRTANFSSIRTHLIQAHKSMPHKPELPEIEKDNAKKAKLEEVPQAVEEPPVEGYTFTRSLLEKSLRLQRTPRGKYQCPYCPYEYGALAIVMAHVRTHTGDKPFQCNYCPYSAADYSAMRKHLIKKHDKWQPKAKIWSGVNQSPQEMPPVMPQEPPAIQEDGQSKALHYVFTCGDAEKGLSFHKSDAGLYQCPYCPHQHKKKSVVRAHVRKHTGEKPYHCKHCTFKCANFSWMREHLIKRHELKAEELSKKSKMKEIKKSKSPVPSGANPPQKKPKCDFLFAPSDTEKHVELSRTNTGSYICVFCKKELRIINNMRAHIRGHIGDKPYYCTRCPFRSAHISALRRHLFTMHRIRNAKGHKSTQQIALAMTQQPQRSPPRIQPEPIPVVQPLKSSVSATNSPIIHNILTAPRPAESAPPIQQHHSSTQKTSPFTQQKSAKYIYEETPTEVALLKSLQASNTLQCPHCGHKFSSISRTMEHVRKHTGAKPYRCLVCNFKSAYEGCISRHVSLKHELSAQQLAQFFTFKIGDIEKSIDLRKDLMTGHYQCPFCEKSWPESAKVKRHMCIHTGEKPYRCNLCGFGAVDKSSMVHHLEMSHKKQITELKSDLAEEQPTPMHLPYQTPSSTQARGNFTVEAKESTKLVLRRVPSSNRRPNPPEKSPPRQNQSLSRPILKVPSPQNSVPPDSCGYDYLPSQSERELLEILNVEGKLKCQYCGKICHSAARTMEHIRMHSGEKPYCCKHCKFSSAYEGVMKKHVMVRHGKGSGLSILYTFKAGKILKSIEFEREENTGRYKCPFCKRTTTSLTGAKRHVCTHTGEKPYKCKLCSYCANERSTILWHIDRNHKNAGEHVPDVPQQQHHKQQAQQNKVEQRKAEVTRALGLAPMITPDARANRSVVSINKRGHIDFSPTHEFKKIHVEPGDTQTVQKLFTFEPGKIERSLNLQRDPVNGRYLCPFCEQTSRDLTNAKNHVRVHIGEKPFKCTLCEYASVQRSLVIAHIEKHHLVYPSAEYSQHDTSISRQAPSSVRHHTSAAPVDVGYRNPSRPVATAQYTEPAQSDDMPLDLSKPLDLSNPGKKQAEPKPPIVQERLQFIVPSDEVAMDLRANVSIQEESQESSMDEEEEAALLEAEMIAEEEMLVDDGDVGVNDEELTGEDEDRLLEEEEEILAEEEEVADVSTKQSQIDQAVPDVSEEIVRSRLGVLGVAQKPVSLVKPLNPNEANEEDEVGTSTSQGKIGGQSVTVGAVVRDGMHPGASHSKKSERNIWDMAFNWSSQKKSNRGEGPEKPPAARTLEYVDAQGSGDCTTSGTLDGSEDIADTDEGAETARDACTDSDANVFTSVAASGEASVVEGLPKDCTRGGDDDTFAARSGDVEIQVGNTSSAPDGQSAAIETEALPQATDASDETSPVIASPRPPPTEDTSIGQELPGTNAWQSMQETTPTKPPSSASSVHTPDGDSNGQQQEDEMSSPASSGSLPVITNVMSLNPSLWKSP